MNSLVKNILITIPIFTMWYLVQKSTKNFTYEVSPAQGLALTDSDNIRKCFKTS